MAISSAQQAEIIRKAQAGIALTNQTPEAMAIYNSAKANNVSLAQQAEIQRKANAGIPLSNPTPTTSMLYNQIAKPVVTSPTVAKTATDPLAQFGGRSGYIGSQQQRYQDALKIGDTNLINRLQADAARVGYSLPDANPLPKAPNPEDYVSQYQQQIEDALSAVNNYQSFNYDPNKDKSFQAFLDLAQQQGNTAFNNQLGTLAANTGGRASSWASAAASQAQNSIIADANAQMVNFENMAYSQYQDQRQFTMDKLNTLLNMDEISYSRHKDNIDMEYQQYNTQLQAQQIALERKANEFSTQLDRVKMMGYVDNEASLALGIKPGTPSYEAQQMAAEKETWLWQQQVQLDNQIKLMNAQQADEKELIRLRDSLSGSSGGSGGGSTKSGSGGNSYGIRNAAGARKYIDALFKENSGFLEMSYADQMTEILDIVREVSNDGTLTEAKKEEILGYLYDNSKASELLKNYELANDAGKAGGH